VRLVVKVLLVLLLVAVVPVAVSGVTGLVLARRALADAAARSLAGEARHLAEVAETTITGSLDDLRQASLLGLHTLAPAERSGALWLIYRADAGRTAVALIDGDTGTSVVDPAFLAAPSDAPGLADHEVLPPSALPTFASHVPLAEAMAAGKAIGVPYADASRGAPFVVLAVRVPGPVGADGRERPWVVAVELSLRRLNARFEETRDQGLKAFLVDLAGKAVCHSDRDVALARVDENTHRGLLALVDPAQSASGVANLYDDDEALVAWARLSRLAGPQGRTWGVVVEQERTVALSAIRELAQRVAFWVGIALVLAVVAGVVLARGVVRPVEVLTDVVARFAGAGGAAGVDGRGGARVRAPALGADEIGTLAVAFNGMADAIDDRDRQLRAFNEDLLKKVDERTRELKDAQDQLIQSQKMAAVGELGATVAHEINNPLAAVLGSAQLALFRIDRADTRVRPHLEDIEKESLRIKDIVESLLRLSQDQSQQAMGTVDVNAVVEAALALVARPIIAARIAVKKELGTNLPRVRGRASDLQQAVLQILQNAREASSEGGTVTIRTDAVDGRLVRILVEDTGHGIAAHHQDRVFEPLFTTRASKGNKGMGLSVVHRIVEDHQGRVVVESPGPGRGTTVKMSFAATRDPQLV
jgi:two-component system NtrC family sensor kinase